MYLGLWRSENWVRRGDYLYAHEWAHCQQLFFRSSPNDPVQDKVRFWRYCIENNFPTIPILAQSSSEGKLDVLGSAAILQTDLFIKPRNSAMGRGAEAWQWLGSGYRRHDGMKLSCAEFSLHLSKHGNIWGGSIAQPCLDNHAQLASLSTSSLASARIVTGRRDNGTIMAIFAMLFVPSAGQIISQLGPCYPIDYVTGRVNLNPGILTLPDWPSMMQTIQQAHQSLTKYTFLGWDIAFCEDGYKIIEVNSGWNAANFQAAQGMPISLNGFDELFRSVAKGRKIS